MAPRVCLEEVAFLNTISEHGRMEPWMRPPKHWAWRSLFLGSGQVFTHAIRDLYHLMAKVAATREEAKRFRTIDTSHIEWLEIQIEKYGGDLEAPTGFVFGGDTTSGVALDLARTIVRRTECLAAELQNEGELSNPHLLQYLNRLSSLGFVPLLFENHQVGVDHAGRATGEYG